MEQQINLMDTIKPVEKKDVLLGYRLKVYSKCFPFTRYVSGIGMVTSPVHAKIFDIRSAKQRAYDLHLAGMTAEIEEVYGKISGGENAPANN